MSKFFIDTEFLEGTQSTFFGKTKPTIDLISIGIVCEDGREYYAISKDFNLKESWNRYDVITTQVFGDGRNIYPNGIKKKVYWIRENVLKPIYLELINRECREEMKNHGYIGGDYYKEIPNLKTWKWNLKRLIKKYGKTNKQIAEEIQKFIFPKYADYDGSNKLNYSPNEVVLKDGYWLDIEYLNPQFYAYYADYDWVALCWLFGKMIDLPKGFPKYCIDLKQILDEKFNGWEHRAELNHNYPKQTNEHHSLSDALWTKELYNFLNNL